MNVSPAATRTLPFAVHIAFLVGASALAFAAETIGRPWALDPRWLYALKSAGIALALVLLWHRYAELRSFVIARAAWVWMLVSGVVVFAIWINLDLPWARVGAATGGFDPRDSAGLVDWRWVGLRTVCAVLLIPIAEELFWRSFLLRWLERREFLSVAPAAVSGRTLIFGAAFFALAHNLWLAAFIAGLVYGWLYRRTGTLWAPIGAHALTNALLAAWVIFTQQWHWW